MKKPSKLIDTATGEILDGPPLPESLDTKATEKALSVLVKALTKKFGPGSVAKLDEPHAYSEIKYVVPTGIKELDEVFGVGGLPGGRLIEIWGAEHSLKSTLASFIVGAAQRLGLAAVKIDTEMSGALAFEQALGVVASRTVVSQPDTLEDATVMLLEGIEALNEAKVPSVHVFDSLAASKLKSEIEAAVDDNDAPGVRARFLGQKLFPKLMELLHPGLATVVIVNQARESIGAGPWAKKTHSPGGRALRHYAHVRIEATPFGQIKSGEHVIGMKARMKAGKNKIAPPFRECILEYYFTPPTLQPEGLPRPVAVEIRKRTPVTDVKNT